MKSAGNLLSLLALAAVAAACSKSAPETEPVRAVRTMVVTSGQAGATREFAAEVRARTESRLSFRVAGKIVQRHVELGQRVKSGQLLAQLDAEDLRRGVDAANAAVVAAETQAEQLRSEFQRFKELRDQGFISGWELERRGAASKAAQAQLDQARAQAQVQRNQAGYASLVANGSGVVTAIDAEVGAVIAPGAPVLRLALDGPRDVVFSVPEDSLPSIRPLLGKAGAVAVRIWGSHTQVPATLRELAASADPTTRTFLAKAEVGRVDVQLGQTASVLIEGPRANGVMLLPLTAIVRQQDKAAVWLVDPVTMTVRQQPVVVAGAQGNEVVVADGLAAGQRVVTAGVHVLTPGQKVKLYAEPTLASTPAAASAASR